jgi:hypothetical protein
MNSCQAGLYSNASAASSALASQLYTSSNCLPQLPAAQQLQHYHAQHHHRQTQHQQQQQQQEQQCLTDGIDASITFINSFLGTDTSGAELDASCTANTDGFENGSDLMQELLGVINVNEPAAAQAHGTSQQHGWMWQAANSASLHSGPQIGQQQQQQRGHSLQDEACLVAETPAAWAAAAAARDANKIQQYQQYTAQQYQQPQQYIQQQYQLHQQYNQLQYQPMQPTVIPATWFAGTTTGASTAGGVTSAIGIAASSSMPTPDAPGLLFAAAAGGSSTSTGTPALLPSLLPSPFVASASISSGTCVTPLAEEEASSSCLSNTDITEAIRRASAEQARQQQNNGPGQQQQQQLQHSWSAPHLAAPTAVGMTASSMWCSEAAANSAMHMAPGNNSSSFSALDLSRASSTPCLSLQQQQLLLAQELFLAQQQQQRVAALPYQQQEVQRSVEQPEVRKALEARKPTDQISSKCSKLFRPRRPQVVPAAAPDLVISDRVKARMQWLHQQRNQQQRSARRQQQQQQQRTKLPLDEHK